MEELKQSDIYLGDQKSVFVKTLKDTTGYPSNLTDNQVVRLIYFFGAKKLSRKSVNTNAMIGSHQTTMLTTEKMAMEEIFKWYGFTAPDERGFASAYKAVTMKFKQLLDFLRAHPAYITPEIYQALQTAGYSKTIQNIVLAIDENRKVVPRLVNESSKTMVAPLGRMESMLWDLQSVSMDKLMLIINSITPKDIKAANLGSKSKALRDIYSMLHMVRMANKNPNTTLINLNVNTAEPREKLVSYSAYLSKNREA